MGGIGVDWEQRLDWDALRTSRVDKMRQAIQNAGLRGLLVQRHENVRYLTSMRGFTSAIYQPRYAAFLPDDGGELTLLSETGDLALAHERMPWLTNIDVWSYSVEENIDTVSRLMNEQGIEDGMVGVDDVTSPAVIFALQKRFPHVEFVDGSSAIAEAKVVKNSQEIELLKMSAGVAEAGMAAAQNAIGIGVRENVVAGQMLRAITEAGADNMVSFPQCSNDAMRRMGSDSQLQAGQVLLVDIHAGMNGYIGDFARTFAVGKPSSDQKRAFEAQKACVAAAIDAIQPGVEVDEVHNAVSRIAHEAGLSEHWASYITGHGVGTGLGPWEQPVIGDAHGTITELREGMAIALEPGFFDPAIGPMRNEEMIIVTSDGAEVLTSYPYDDAFA